MSEPGLVLVDTSVWVRFFRQAHTPEARLLDELLTGGPVATCAPIRAEVVSGAPTEREWNRLRKLFDALVPLEPPQDLWHRVEEDRFRLARRGYQASLVDLMIALTAQAHHTALWTLDDDFDHIGTVVSLPRYLPATV